MKATYIHGTTKSEQARLAKLNQLTNDSFVSFLELTNTSRVLELGSGLGILASEVAKKVPRGEVWGVEYSTDQLKLAKSESGNLRFVQADAHHLPFRDKTFDVAYSRYVLEHLADPVRVLEEVHRVLKPGGKMFVQENNILMCMFDPDCPKFDRVWSRFAILQSRLGGDALIGKRLFRHFKNAGFKEIELSMSPEIHHSGQSTLSPWIMNLIWILEGGRKGLEEEELASGKEIDEAINELKSFLERKDATALFYWNRAIATRS